MGLHFGKERNEISMTGKTNSIMGASGCKLIVSTIAGVTVTIAKDGRAQKKIANTYGIATFNGLSSGEWTLTITDGTKTASKIVNISADYSEAISFSTIHVTYPAGSACTASDGVTTLQAPDTSGTWDCVIPNAGTWTVSLDSGLRETVTIAANGETHTIDKWYLYDNGDDRADITGGWTAKGFKNSQSAPLTAAAPTVKKSDDSMTLTEASGGKCGICYITNKIDLTNISTLAVTVGNVSYKSGYSIRLRVKSDLGTYLADNQAAFVQIPTGTGKNTVTLDVSGVSGEQYIVLSMLSGGSSSSKITVYELEAR